MTEKNEEKKVGTELLVDAINDKATIRVDVTTRGKQWKGDFVFRRPTIAEVGKIGVAVALRNGDMSNIPAEANIINTTLAHCDVILESAPEWFKDRERFTVKTVVFELFTKLMEWLREE